MFLNIYVKILEYLLWNYFGDLWRNFVPPLLDLINIYLIIEL